jgi:hypothetical protein
MVEATDFANRDDLAEFRPLDCAAVWRILFEREVNTALCDNSQTRSGPRVLVGSR